MEYFLGLKLSLLLLLTNSESSFESISSSESSSKEYFTRVSRSELNEESSTLEVCELPVREKSENDVFLVSRDFTDDSENTLPAPLEIDAVTLPAPWRLTR